MTPRVTRQQRRSENRRGPAWFMSRYTPTFNWSRFVTKNNDPAYRKSIWPAEKIARRAS